MEDWFFVVFLDLDLDSLRSLVVVTLVVLFFGKEELSLDRSEEDFLVTGEVVLVEFEDLVEVELSFFNWDFSASFSSGVALLMSLVFFLVELETESDKESLVFASLVWFLIVPKPEEEEEEILVNLVWFLEEPVVDLMSLVWFLELESELNLDFFLIG